MPMKSIQVRAFSLLICALCAPLTALAAAQQPTHEFILDNGLKVIVREDHRAPLAVSQLWYKVGSSYETPGQTGLSHALEHMMFKGSQKLAPGEASRILRELGAEENAFTSDDYTAYYQVLARDRLGICPLYSCESDGWFYFGSEIKALLAAGEIAPRADPLAIDHIFSFFAMAMRRDATTHKKSGSSPSPNTTSPRTSS